MKKISLIVVAMIITVFAAAMVFAATQDKYEFKGGAMGKVAFDHKKHQDSLKDCKTCHHKDEAGKETGCTKCHAKDSKVNTKQAFHDNCIKCHKDKKQGPTGCKDCHKK